LKRVFGISLAILLLIVVAACSNNEPAIKQGNGLEKVSQVSVSDVFQKSCIACHSTGDITGGQIKIAGSKNPYRF
jgi:hypothetical protein